MAKFKIVLGDTENVKALLQEIYDEACMNLNDIQNQINKIKESTPLSEETMDGKAKFAKAMNDFFVTRGKAADKKLEIARILNDFIKNENKDGNAILTSHDDFDWDDIKETQTVDGKEEYKLK